MNATLSGMATITLFSSCLLSKWGFNDGDDPDTWVDYCDAHGIDWANAEWHPVLIQLVRRYLLPQIEQDVQVVEIQTIHNPIRAERVNGVDVTGCWYQGEDSGPVLTPESVEIPIEDVAKVAREVMQASA
jgi:hypothetical protein